MGVGFISSLSVAIFGGTAPYINTWLGAQGIGLGLRPMWARWG